MLGAQILEPNTPARRCFSWEATQPECLMGTEKQFGAVHVEIPIFVRPFLGMPVRLKRPGLNHCVSDTWDFGRGKKLLLGGASMGVDFFV